MGHGVLIAEEDVLHAVLPEAGDVGGNGGAGGGALNKYHTPRGEDLSGVAGLYAAGHGVGALNGQSRVQPLDGDPAGKEAAHHHAAGQGFGGVLLHRGRDVVVLVVVRLGRGDGGVVVAHPLHHGAVRVQTGQPSSCHLVFRIRKGIRGYFAVAAADGRGLGIQYLTPRLGRHLGVAADDDVIGIIGVAGRCIRVCLRRAACTVADACRVVPTHSLDRAAPDGDVAAGSLRSSADACAAAVAALGGEGSFGVVVVLDGQLARDGFAIFRHFIVLLKTRFAAAAFQLVVAVQLDGGIAAALHGDGGFALPGRAVTAAIHLGLAADVNFQVVEGDVHVALGGVDGDGMLLRLAGDDGVSVLLLDGLALCDPVCAFVARFHDDVAVGNVPPGRIGRDAGTHHDARDDGGGHAPPECALQSHSLSSFGRFVV